jgi:disulfide bond formation protein DsbB
MQVDPRGQRMAAAVTTIVLAIVLITGSVWLLAVQTAVFAVGAVLGLKYAPYGVLYARLVRPRLGPPAELEDAAPPRFAQGVGLVFALVGLAGYATGTTWLGMAATALALVAAFLNAVFGLCLGCEMYPLIVRVLHRDASRTT